MEHLFPNLLYWGYGKIFLAVGALATTLLITITWLKIDSSTLKQSDQILIISVAIFLIWLFVIRLVAKMPLDKWLKKFWYNNAWNKAVHCELDSSGKLKSSLTEQTIPDLIKDAIHRDIQAFIYLPFARIEDSQMIFIDQRSLLGWWSIKIKNITSSSDKEPMLIIDNNPQAWLGDKKRYTLTMYASEVLRHQKNLRHGVDEFINKGLSERDDVIKEYEAICKATASHIFATKRFKNSETPMNSKDAQSIRKDLEAKTNELKMKAENFTLPIGQRL